MLLVVATLLAGLVLLSYGADRFVTGAITLARQLEVPPLIIGLTLVGMATSIPEVLVSSVAAWQARMPLAVGNAVGSNIANMGLILGICALIYPLTTISLTLRREFILMSAAILTAGLLVLNLELNRTDGLLLLIGLGISLWLIARMAGRGTADDPLLRPAADAGDATPAPGRSVLNFAGGLLMLLVGAELLVRAAVTIALELGVSELVIGLTLVAMSTSLPELAATLASLAKREADIAIGNIIGSNMFNMWAVLGIPALVRPGGFGADLIARDFPVMLALTVVMGLLLFTRRHGHIGRPGAAILLLCFTGYQYWLFSNPTITDLNFDPWQPTATVSIRTGT